MGVHSDIGASSAYRWMNCPGSIRLYRQIVRGESTEYASLGTAAHELCEKCLRDNCDPESCLGENITVEGKNFTVSEEMVASTSIYVQEVRNDFNRVGGVLNVEKSFQLDWLYPGMFGRNDASITPNSVFKDTYIFDYKNGRKAVYAENNEQCMYYALGALGAENLWCSELVVCKIIQPNTWEKDTVDEWEIKVKDLYSWGYEVLKPAAKRTEDPKAPCVTGEWCCFCEAAAICPGRKQEALALLDVSESSETLATVPAITEMTPEQIGRASEFFTSDVFTSWVKALSVAELSYLQKGVNIPGRKLVESRVLGNRRWADTKGVVEALIKICGDEIMEKKIKSPAQMEKLLTAHGYSKSQRDELIAPLVTRDEGTKTLVVSENDSRESVSEKKKQAIDLF